MKNKENGVFETTKWKEKLVARVIKPGPEPKIHGYNVQADLARHYGFMPQVLLALTGDLPDESTCVTFEVLLSFHAPASLAEAPTHAGRLAHYMRSPSAGTMSTGFAVLTEQVQSLVVKHLPLIEWLSNPSNELSPVYLSDDPDHRAAISRLKEAIDTRNGITYETLERGVTLDAALIAGLHECGLRTSGQFELALAFSRLVPMSMEAFAAKAGDLWEYPLRLPDFQYVGD